MEPRSKYVLGKYVFIKLIKPNQEDNKTFYNSLQNGNYIPFNFNEIASNYLIGKYEKDILTPGNKVFFSDKDVTLSQLQEIKNSHLNEIVDELRRKINLQDFQSNANFQNAKSYLIISQRMTGNLFDLKFNTIEKLDKKELEDVFIHIFYLYFKLQNIFKMVHGDSKLANYTWLRLDNTIDITYDFRDEFNSSNERIIVRKNVKNLFYLTDLEFVFSPLIKAEIIQNKKFYYNFSQKHEWLNDEKKGLIYVPKITVDPFYDYSINFGGYNAPITPITPINITPKKSTIKDIFNLFPRMFCIDLLIIFKTILTFDYADRIPADLLRKFNIYFTLFQSLSKEEENAEKKYKVDYEKVSPASLANFLV